MIFSFNLLWNSGHLQWHNIYFFCTPKTYENQVLQIHTANRHISFCLNLQYERNFNLIGWSGEGALGTHLHDQISFIFIGFLAIILPKQVCIPVGYVPPACWPYLPACTVRGVSAPGGGCLLLGGCLLPGSLLSQHALRQNPLWTGWQTGAKVLPCPKLRL